MKNLIFAVVIFGIGIFLGMVVSPKENTITWSEDDEYKYNLIILQDSALHMSDSLMNEYNMWDVMGDDYTDQYYRVRTAIDSIYDENI